MDDEDNPPVMRLDEGEFTLTGISNRGLRLSNSILRLRASEVYKLHQQRSRYAVANYTREVKDLWRA